jgi:hypothetical protein
VTEPVSYAIPEDPANPWRLGRRVHHDPASRAYPFAEHPDAAVPVVSRDRWPSTIGILNQRRLGSCVPNTGVERIAFGDAVRPGLTAVTYGGQSRSLDERLAVDWYHDVTAIDPFDGTYPPDDTGSDGTSLAKLLKSLGLIDSYTHAFGGLPEVLAALMTGPVPVGVPWYDSMFQPTRDGELVITPNAQVAGGHEFNLDGELDVDRRRVWMTNHWYNGDGSPWGVQGRAWMSYDTLARLLGEDGDATIMHTVPTEPLAPPAPGGDGWFRVDAPVGVAVARWATRHQVPVADAGNELLRRVLHVRR